MNLISIVTLNHTSYIINPDKIVSIQPCHDRNKITYIINLASGEICNTLEVDQYQVDKIRNIFNKKDEANLVLYRFLDAVDTATDMFKPELENPYVKHILFLVDLAKQQLEKT